MVWPAALAGGHDPELAATVGYEVTIRAARAFGPEHRRTWHPSSTAGVLGAAAARAVSAGCTFDETLVCLGHATSLATGLGQGILEERDTAVLHRLHAARTAELCLEALGLSPPKQGFEGERGLLAAFGGDSAPLGEPLTLPAIAEVSFRLYPVTGLLQGLAETAGSVALAPDDAAVAVVVAPGAVGLVDRPAPRTEWDRWWSAQWTAAAYLLRLDPADPGNSSRIEVLAARVTVTAGPQPMLTVGARSVPVEERRHARADELHAKWSMLNPEQEPPQGLLD